MVLNVGLVSAVLLAKKHNGYRTRLDNLQARYKKKTPLTMNLYQVPLKYIVFILMILSFIFGLAYLLHQFSVQSKYLQKLKLQNDTRLLTEQANINFSYLSNNDSHLPYQQFSHISVTNTYYCNNYMLINIIYAIQIFGILCILFSEEFQFRKITITKKCIYIDKFTIIKRHKRSKIILKDYNHIDIRLIKKGSNKFTHKNQNFFVILEGEIQNTRFCLQIVKRGDVYHGRKALIQICAVLGITPNLTLKKYKQK